MGKNLKSYKVLVVSYSRTSLGYIVPMANMAAALQSLHYDVYFACGESSGHIPRQRGVRNIMPIFEKEPLVLRNYDFDDPNSYKKPSWMGLEMLHI